ncbi:hypothetical protein COLO4_01787, partial [Corchorus olitorius]
LMVTDIKFAADIRDLPQPGEFRHQQMPLGSPGDNRGAVVNQAADQQRNRNDKQQQQQNCHGNNGQGATSPQQMLQANHKWP